MEFKLHISLRYGKISQNFTKSWSALLLKIALTWSWSIPVYWLLKGTNNDRHILHTWLDKDYRSPVMWKVKARVQTSHIMHLPNHFKVFSDVCSGSACHNGMILSVAKVTTFPLSFNKWWIQCIRTQRYCKLYWTY